MKRHKWIKDKAELVNGFAEQHECENCGIYRFKALGSWLYSEEILTDENPFPEEIQNEGCKKKQPKTNQL